MSTTTLAQARVLIVDDQPYMRKVLRAMLGGLGVVKLYEAPEGASALAKIVSVQPDVIIVDWDMPMMDGLQFIQKVRSRHTFPNPDVPIVMLTGHAERWRVIEATRLGVHEFLLKPVATSALRDRLISALDRRREMVMVQDNYIPSPRRLCVLDID